MTRIFSKILLSFFFLFLFDLDIDDVGVAVWSGKDVALKRVSAQAKTWIRAFKDVTIFSDYFYPGVKEELQNIAQPTKLHFVELGNCNQVWLLPNNWERAQPRFVKSMEMFYRMNESKKWYFFIDDDSYPIKRNLFKVLSQHNPNESKVLGHFYCSWNQVVYGKEDDDRCLLFAQGGAGVAVSNAYFKEIAPHLTECNNKFNHRQYAGSMRFAKCSEDYAKGRWSEGYIIDKRNEEFFSADPICEINNGFVHKPPVNFHFMSPAQIIRCHYGVRTDWVRKTDNASVFIDWSPISGKEFPIPYGPTNIDYKYRFGWAIAVPSKNFENEGGLLGAATTPLIPRFSDSNHEYPIGFTQQFSDTAFIDITCDQTMNDWSFEHLRSTNRDMFKIYAKMKCPPVEEYKW